MAQLDIGQKYEQMVLGEKKIAVNRHMAGCCVRRAHDAGKRAQMTTAGVYIFT